MSNPLELPDFRSIPRTELKLMAAAAEEIYECYRVLERGGLNIVGECIGYEADRFKGREAFYEYDHYPEGDVFDSESGGQYYYHAHRGLAGEHGHFHTFVRRDGMPPGVEPVPYEGDAEWPAVGDEVAHIVAISMDARGFPIGFFTTNRWVTDETWYRADDVMRMVDNFEIDHAFPSWPANRWITCMFRLFRPQIEALLHQRDEVIASWAETRPDVDVFEDRELEITGQAIVSVEEQLKRVKRAISG
ncbi:MAG: hypothetical protein AAF493_19390 [Pseudomonadota bacterium]